MPLMPLLSDPERFAEEVGGLRLRSYQRQVMRAVIDSISRRQGLSFVVIFPRQSGKNELQAHLENYLLTAMQMVDTEVVKLSPTWKPQSLNAMRRLERVLGRNALLRGVWRKESGYIYRAGRARVLFLSGAPEAHIVGATATDLLEVDEAQDIRIDKYDKEIAPMAASNNATRIFWGTAWSSDTLLGRELRAARDQEERDGIRRAFVLTADQVSAEVPAYGAFVAEQVARLGRDHPYIRTQFYSEEVDGQGGLFPPARRALMQGDHPYQEFPTPGKLYAFLIDVGGAADEFAAELPIGSQLPLPGIGGSGISPHCRLPIDPAELGGGGMHAPAPREQAGSRRDMSVLTIVQADLATLEDPARRAPTYRVVSRRAWSGAGQPALLSQIQAAAAVWQPRVLVADATGLGAGLAGFLEKSFPGRVVPFVFSQASKSRLGWNFLALCDAGRYREFAPPDALFWEQARACRFEMLPGPGRILRWGVPDGSRDPLSGRLLHDDALLSASLCALLDEVAWTIPGGTRIIPARDPLQDVGW